MAAVNDTSQSSTSLREFINESRSRLQSILAQLGWTEEGLQTDYNSNSIAAKARKISGDVLTHREPDLPASCATSNSVTLTPTELQTLLNDPSAEPPKKFSDLQLKFTREQKLLLYEHVLANTEKYAPPTASVPALDGGTLSFAEIVAQKKREKNKRRHRRSKPTHIEQVRGVVDLQMQALEQYYKTKIRDEQKQECHQENEKDRIQRSQPVERARERSPNRGRRIAERYRQRSRSRSQKRHKKRSRSRSVTRKDNKRNHSRETKRHKKHHSRNIDHPHKHRHRSKSPDCESRNHHRRSRSRENDYKRHRRRSSSSAVDSQSYHRYHSRTSEEQLKHNKRSHRASIKTEKYK